MSTYNNNVRIYASIGGQAKFYDVIGRYLIPGGVANSSGSSYAIDLGLYLPVIRTTVTYNGETQYKYYYIPVDSSNSNRIHTASEVPSANNNLIELFIGNTTYPTYSQVNGTPDDLYALANSYPLDRAVTIYTFNNNGNTANATWSLYNLEVVENNGDILYLIRLNENTIYDNANLLSQQGEESFSLVETNDDNALIDPSSSTVESLTTFTVTYPNKHIVSIASSGHSIKIFNALTLDVVRDIGLPTLLDGFDNKITFSTNINLPGSYYLYIPFGTINFSSGSSKRFIKRYTILAQNAGGDPLAYTASPLAGTIYEDLSIEFVNVDSIVGWDSTNRLQVDLMNGNTVVSGTNRTLDYGNTGYTCSMEDNVFKISGLNTAISSLGSTYERDTNNKKIRITIPQNTVHITNSEYNNQILIYYTLIGTNSSSSSSDNITYSVYPYSGSNLYKLYKLEFTFPLTSSNQLIIVDLDKSIGVIANELYTGHLFKYASSETKYTYLGGYRQVQLYFYLYNNNQESIIDLTGSYEVSFPEGVFIKSDGDNILSTQQFTLSYNVVGYSADELSDDFNNYYCHGLLRIKGNRLGVSNGLSFRESSNVKDESNTIFVDNALLLNITLLPLLELTETVVDNDGNDTGTLKQNSPSAYTLLKLDILVMSLSISGEDLRVNYRYDYDPNRTYSDENSLLFRYNNEVSLILLLGLTSVSLLPKKLHIDFVMNFNDSRFKFNTYILILPHPIYLNYKDSIDNGTTYFIKNNVDLYTGKESEKVYVSSESTQYDEIVSEKLDDDGTDILRYPAKLESVTKVRLGNLDGIYDEKQKGRQPYGFGLYGQNVFLTGNFYLNNGRSLVDISDDILLATGNITGIRERIENLNDEFKDLSTELSTDLRFMRDAMPASISNFISTNKTALFRLGLDTSIWALGSAGISLYNPNVSYVPDNKTGKMVVNESTVGDFDESILMLADNIKINNYVKAIIGSSVYYKVLVCDVNPKSWVYDKDLDGKMIVSTNPKYEYNGNLYPIGEGNLKYAWVNLNLITNINNSVGSNAIKMANTFNCETILRYIKIDDNYDEISVVGKDSPGLVYSFSNYYYKLNGLYYANPGDSNYTAIFNSETYFVPVTVQAALFDNGIINARYIRVQNVTAENILAISSDYLEGHSSSKYNEAFDITKEINESNYPVITGSGDNYENDYDADFVVISGTTGAITATSADISGNITIGNRYSNNENTYLKLYKGGSSDAPGMYIYRRDDNDSSIFNEVASFGGLIKQNPLSRFKSGGNGSIESGIYVTGSPIVVSASIDLLPNPHSLPLEYSSNYDELVVGHASNSVTTSYTSSNYMTIFVEDENAIYLSGRLQFSSYPSFSSSNVPNCSANAYARSLVYLKKHGSSSSTGMVYLGSYSYLYSKYRTNSYYNSGYSLNTYSSGVNNMTFSVEVPPTLMTNGSYILDLYIQTTVSFSFEPTTNSNKSGSITYNTGTLGISGSYDTLKYNASFFGNGLTIGYNSQNYFGTYFLDNKMTFDFLSNGAGMLFDNGNVYYLLFGKQIPAGIPILEGTIYLYKIPNTSNTGYTFEGFSIIGGSGYSSRSLINSFSVPCLTTNGDNHLEGNSDYNVYNKYVYTESYGNDISLTKLNSHKIYLLRTDRQGVFTLVFGNEWDNLIGINFGRKLMILTTALGTLLGSGPSYITIPYISRGNAEKMLVSGGDNYQNVTNCTVDGNTCSTFICMCGSDDYSVNDVAFNINIMYYPNLDITYNISYEAS